jgi:phosphoribosylanthranilate isomerase
MMVKVKICGITSAIDALMAASAGADAIGFNFFKPSPRYVEPDRARAIRLALPPFLTTVGLFVDRTEEAVTETMQQCGLDCVQLHGKESPRMTANLRRRFATIKAIRVRGEENLKELERYEADAFLLDAFVSGMPGGTGQTFDWELARRAASRVRLVLAGGLTPDNVAEAVRAARPFAVDVASGVESEPGKKSRKLVTDFVRAAKSVVL